MIKPQILENFKVTIITVVKNAEKVKPSLFNSVRNLKSKDVEFIVLDGLSEDGTVEIIKKNEDIIDKWLSEPDKGIYDAMNKAIKLARGEWLIFMGFDDELLDGFNQIIPLLKEKNTIYYGKAFFHNTFITGEIKSNYMLTKTNICHQTIFYHRTVFEKYNYQTEFIKCADYVLNLKLWDDPDFKFIFCDYLISNFPEGGFSTYTRDVLFEKKCDQLFKQYLKPASYYRYLNRTVGAYNMFKRMLFNN
jgi:glycosyltransferase involved in cell wall biosynthesis